AWAEVWVVTVYNAVHVCVVGVVRRTGRGHAPDWIVQLLGRVLYLDLDGAGVGKPEAMRPPAGLRHDLIRHQALEHPARVRGDERQAGTRVGVVALPHREVLAGLRVGVGLPGAAHRPLALPGEVGAGGTAVGERSRGGPLGRAAH